ncbi:MAG: DUF4249 domain-containing protein [Chitinophagaceae bacterium]
MKLIITCIVSLVFISCEKSIDFELDELEPKIVVDASIENGLAPRVILSKSFNYFSEITPQLLLGSFIHGADVTISNGTKTHKLKEDSINLAPGAAIYFYSVDSANVATSFVGEMNKSYLLTIKVANREYSASTTIPALTKKLDSLWWKPSPGNPDTTKVSVITRITDPPGLGNYIRYFTSTGKGPFLPGLNSVFDDQIIDGSRYDAEVERGVDRNEKIDFENYSFFNRGDTVTVKFCNIDKATFDFWRTMEYSYSSIGNPFSSPTKVLGNLQGGALGYFGGYAVQYKSLIIPR